MKKEVYVNRLSSFLPNTPVDNEHIEDFIGFIEGKKSRIKSIVLKRNGIKRRHYALDTGGKVTHRNSEMVVEAIKKLFDGNGDIRRVDTLCCATTTRTSWYPRTKRRTDPAAGAGKRKVQLRGRTAKSRLTASSYFPP